MSWRRIPHPSYGNYGGALNKCKRKCDDPIDWMDDAFKQHDDDLGDNRMSGMVADTLLVDALLAGNVKDLDRPLYGRVYRIGCIIIFTVMHIWK